MNRVVFVQRVVRELGQGDGELQQGFVDFETRSRGLDDIRDRPSEVIDGIDWFRVLFSHDEYFRVNSKIGM